MQRLLLNEKPDGGGHGCGAEQRSDQPQGQAQLTFGQRECGHGTIATSVRHTHDTITVGHDTLLNGSAFWRNGQSMLQGAEGFRANRHAPTQPLKLRLGRQFGKVSKALRQKSNDGTAHLGGPFPFQKPARRAYRSSRAINEAHSNREKYNQYTHNRVRVSVVKYTQPIS